MDKELEKIKLMCDYYSFPLWWCSPEREAGDIDPEKLPLSEELKHDLLEYGKLYDSFLDIEEPNKTYTMSLSSTKQFINLGIKLWNCILIVRRQ